MGNKVIIARDNVHSLFRIEVGLALTDDDFQRILLVTTRLWYLTWCPQPVWPENLARYRPEFCHHEICDGQRQPRDVIFFHLGTGMSTIRVVHIRSSHSILFTRTFRDCMRFVTRNESLRLRDTYSGAT